MSNRPNHNTIPENTILQLSQVLIVRYQFTQELPASLISKAK